MPAHSALDTLIWARPMARPSFFCTAGRTTFTVCGRRPVAGAGLSSDTPRNGQQSVVAVDVIDLIDALKIPKAAIAGFDWGARSANIVAALWPERCKALGSVSGYLIGSQQAGQFRCRPRRSCNGGTNITSPLNAAEPGTRNTGASFRSSSGGWLRRTGSSTMPPSIAAPPLSTTRITSAS